jgi:hypothetical protein
VERSKQPPQTLWSNTEVFKLCYGRAPLERLFRHNDRHRLRSTAMLKRLLGGYAVASVVVVTALGGCSSSGSDTDGGQRLGPNKTPAACQYIAALDTAAAKAKAADPKDAEAFAGVMTAAKAEYIAGLESLRKAVPEPLPEKIDSMKKLVESDDFAAAAAARAPLDNWVSQNC